MRTYEDVFHVHPELGEAALRASGHRGVGNRIPGSLVLRDGGWNVHDAFDAMTTLQEWSRSVLESSRMQDPYWTLRSLEHRLLQGTRSWSAQGSTGPCPCLICRVRRLWIQDLEEALSEY